MDKIRYPPQKKEAARPHQFLKFSWWETSFFRPKGRKSQGPVFTCILFVRNSHICFNALGTRHLPSIVLTVFSLILAMPETFLRPSWELNLDQKLTPNQPVRYNVMNSNQPITEELDVIWHTRRHFKMEDHGMWQVDIQKKKMEIFSYRADFKIVNVRTH